MGRCLWCSDTSVFCNSQVLRSSELERSMDWLCCNSKLSFERETKQSLVWVRCLNLSVQVYCWKDSTGIHINIVFWGSEGIHISIVLWDHKNLEHSVFSFPPPPHSCLKTLQQAAALQNHNGRFVIFPLSLSLQCGRTSFLFPFPVVKDCTYIVLLAVEQVLGSRMLCFVQYATR